MTNTAPKGDLAGWVAWLVAVILVITTCPPAQTAIWNGSVRIDYQSTPIEGTRQNSLTQQYYLRVTDRLFCKNQITFIGTLDHYGRQKGRLADVRPRYQWLLDSYGYGGQLAYEPYTQKQPGINADQDVSRRWRANIYAQPVFWPRFTYDMLRARRSQTSQGTGTEHWDSYMATWQPKSTSLALNYSRQKRTAQSRVAELVEVYRASALADKDLPAHHRLNASYSFDRTWSKRSSRDYSSQDQHSASVGIIGDPFTTINWTVQYSGRFQRASASTDTAGPRHPIDHLATGAINWTPGKVFTAGVSRYFDRAGARSGQEPQRTDYWQGRATAEGRLYRQMRVLATIYRIYYTGSPKGWKYSDAYFLSMHGQPYSKADWSAEISLADRHGRQAERFGGTVNLFTRMQPLASAQSQIGYTALITGTTLGTTRITDEGYNANLQYNPTDNMGVSATCSFHRNRIIQSKWTTSWTVAGTYRWPSFASVSVNYIQQQILPATTAPGTTGVSRRPSTLLANVIFSLGMATTLNAQYTDQVASSGIKSQNWGIGFTTSF